MYSYVNAERGLDFCSANLGTKRIAKASPSRMGVALKLMPNSCSEDFLPEVSSDEFPSWVPTSALL